MDNKTKVKFFIKRRVKVLTLVSLSLLLFACEEDFHLKPKHYQSALDGIQYMFEANNTKASQYVSEFKDELNKYTSLFDMNMRTSSLQKSSWSSQGEEAMRQSEKRMGALLTKMENELRPSKEVATVGSNKTKTTVKVETTRTEDYKIRRNSLITVEVILFIISVVLFSVYFEKRRMKISGKRRNNEY